ncbi:MAG: type II toxin-antitoxin system RelE/ParE family toxin [Rhodothermaceae bacterium]|nr:type II toxin-antitoxin system RelE/ParE family toxin [Rhodothermaceae bacterium]
MFQTTRKLEAFPRSGRMIPESEDDQLRELIYREYRIMYHVGDKNEEVLILTVIHSSCQFVE